MPKRAYNALKFQVLDFLGEREWVRPAVICAFCGVRRLSTCESYLERLHRWKLLDRSYRGPGTLMYRINRRGRERLAWLRDEARRPF